MADGLSNATTAATARIVLAHEPPVRLGPLTIAPALRQIVHTDGRDEIVEPKVMEVLVALLKADGAILTRSELCDAAWDGRIVGDDAINRVLARLRRLTEGIGAGVFRVETITKVGYRLVQLGDEAATSADGAAPAAAPAEPISRVAEPIPSPAGPGIALPRAAAAHAATSGTADTAETAALTGRASSAPRRMDRRVLIGGGVALAAAAGAGAGAGGWWWRRGDATDDSVAVLPFANLSGDPAQAYFSDGIAEELRSALTRIVRLKVAARTSSELMRAADAPTAAAKLGVANIVTGSVRRGAGTIRVSAQLVDGRTGLTRWSDSYDRAVGDVLTVETNIAESVAGALNIVLRHAEKLLLTAGGTTSPVAHDAYLRGLALANAQKRPLALAAFDAAIAADPNFALGHAARASVMVAIATNDGDTPERTGLAAAEREARHAVALAPGLGATLAQLGYVLQYQMRLREAAGVFAAAYARSPNDATVLWRLAVFQALMGHGDEALRLVNRAQPLDPLAHGGVSGAGYILLRSGHVDAAIASLRAHLRVVPGHPGALEELGYALIAAGRFAEALTAAAQLPPTAWPRETIEAMARARLGDRAGSDRALAALRRSSDIQYQLAQVYAQRDEPGHAFAALDQALAVRDSGILAMKTDPLLAPLRDDSRFAALESRIGYP